MTWPAAGAPVNIGSSVRPPSSSVTSPISRPKRRSGLSVPKRSMASAKRSRGKTAGASLAEHSFTIRPISSSTSANTSSWVAKAISRSIW